MSLSCPVYNFCSVYNLIKEGASAFQNLMDDGISIILNKVNKSYYIQ
jgi:hypothetical protein